MISRYIGGAAAWLRGGVDDSSFAVKELEFVVLEGGYSSSKVDTYIRLYEVGGRKGIVIANLAHKKSVKYSMPAQLKLECPEGQLEKEAVS